MKIGPGFHAVLREGSGQGSRASRRGRPSNGSSAGRRSGAGSRTTPRPTCSSTAPAIPGVWNPDLRPGDNKWSCDDLRARRRHRRGALGLPGHRARRVGLRRDHGEHPRRHGLRRPSAQAARSSRAAPASSTCSIAKPASCCRRRRIEPTNWASGYDLKTGKAARGSGQADALRHRHAGHLSVVDRREGCHPVGVLAAHRPALHPRAQHLHGLRRHRGQLHRRHAVSRRRREDVSRVRAATRASSSRGTSHTTARPGA